MAVPRPGDVAGGDLDHAGSGHVARASTADFSALAQTVLHRRGLFRGQLIKLYIIVYATYRFASETIRPEARLWGNLTVYQWASLLLIPLFAWLWARDGAKLTDSDFSVDGSGMADVA